jgi:hypothetical protein
VLFIDRLFHSSCERVLQEDPDKLKKGLALKFIGEEGMVSIFVYIVVVITILLAEETVYLVSLLLHKIIFECYL